MEPFLSNRWGPRVRASSAWAEGRCRGLVWPDCYALLSFRNGCAAITEGNQWKSVTHTRSSVLPPRRPRFSLLSWKDCRLAGASVLKPPVALRSSVCKSVCKSVFRRKRRRPARQRESRPIAFRNFPCNKVRLSDRSMRLLGMYELCGGGERCTMLQPIGPDA